MVPQLSLVFLPATPRSTVGARSGNHAPPSTSPSPTSARIRCWTLRNNASHAQTLKYAFHPRGLFIETNENKVAHKQATPIYPGTNACAYSDTPASNCTSSTYTIRPPKFSTRLFLRPARPSIDKSQVSKPFPILAYDERDLFDAIASGDVQTKARKIPKADEKKVKIYAPKLIKSNPQSKSWYTPAPAQTPTTGTLQQSTNATPRKVDVTRANPTKESKNHGLTRSEGRRNGVESKKRHVPKRSITHPDCPWIESTKNPTPRHVVRFATGDSYESDRTVVQDEVPTRADAEKEEEATPLVKSVQKTLRPRVRPVSKPLPDLPPPDSVASRWSASTGSAYDDGAPCNNVLNMFPEPPEGMPSLNRFNDWENSNSLSTPPVFMSCPNTSSSSVATITPTAVSNSPVNPLMLKAAPEPKIVTVVHQIPRASCSYTQPQDSIVIRDGRAYPHESVKGSIHNSSIRTTGAASTLRQRSSSFNSSQSQSPSKRVANLKALLWRHRRRASEDIERIGRERLDHGRKHQTEEQGGRELERFEMEFGCNPWCKGEEMDPNGFELVGSKKGSRVWL
jgi:hypothetical protein